MKRNIMFMFIFLIFVTLHAQQRTYKFYYNDELEEAGYAYASFGSSNHSVDTMPQKIFEEILNDKYARTKELKKLSKMNIWLCWQALYEYDFQEGETYVVFCAKPISYENECIMVFLTITDGGKSFIWRAFLKKF